MENIAVLRRKIDILTENTIYNICSSVIDRVDEFFTGGGYAALSKGVIHGDLTLENLVFKKRDGSNEYLVNGVIDFMDTNIGGYIFEVANAMCSVMHAAVINGGIDPFMAVGITLKSILEHSFFNSTELDALFISVMGRLCTLIIFCRHDAANSPQTANHISLKFDILERILQDMWSIGNDEWKKSVLMEPTKNGVISLSNSLLREA